MTNDIWRTCDPHLSQLCNRGLSYIKIIVIHRYLDTVSSLLIYL